MSNKIVFFGNERLATGVTTEAPILQSLLAAGYEVVAVVAQHETGSSRKPRQLEIAAVAEQYGIPLLLPAKLGEVTDQLKSLQADVAVLAAYGKIVPQAVIDIFPQGIVNIHPSKLPRHRGPTPLESVLLAGEDQTAVSLMQLTAKMDSGPVYAQQLVSVERYEPKQHLADKLSLIGRDMLLAALPDILNGNLKPQAQDDAGATYDSLLTKEKSTIDWSRSAVEIERHIRANAGWPKSRTTIGDRDVVITKAHIIPDNGDSTPGVLWLQNRELGMQTSEGIVIIDELIPAGKKAMTGSEFLLGYRPTSA